MHQLITRRALLAAGVTDAELRGRLHRRQLVRLASGTYVDAARYDAASIDDRYVLLVIAEAQQSPDLVVSHSSAAALHGLPLLGVDLTRVHLTRDGRGGHRVARQRTVHAGDLPEHRKVKVGDLLVTDVARTLVDLARTERGSYAVVAGDAALNRGLITPDALAEALADAHWHKGRPGAVRALGQLDGRSESPGETLLRLALIDLSLGPLELQVEILDQTGRLVGRVDAALLDQGILIEFDGKIKYGALLRPGQSPTDAVLAEKRREERLTELGWLVIRVTWSDLHDRARLVERVRGAAAARRRLVANGGIRGSVVLRPELRIAS